jgi:hypothetical protein
VRRATVDSEDVARHIGARPHSLEDIGIALGDRSELRVTVLSRSRYVGNRDVVDHPPFIPAALVVDNKQRRDVRKDVVEGARIVRVSRQPGFGF